MSTERPSAAPPAAIDGEWILACVLPLLFAVGVLYAIGTASIGWGNTLNDRHSFRARPARRQEILGPGFEAEMQGWQRNDRRLSGADVLSVWARWQRQLPGGRPREGGSEGDL